MMNSRAGLLPSLLLAVLLPLVVLGSSGCGRGTSTPKNEVWTRQFGTSDSDDFVFAAVADGSGNIYVTGGTYNPLKADAFIIKCDVSGNEIWTSQFGTSLDDFAFAVVADGSGNIYVAGGTDGTFPGQLSSVGFDPFVAKYDASGNEIWTRQFGQSESDVVRAMVADEAGNIYMAGGTGEYAGQRTYLGSGVENADDTFFTKYDASGNEVWTRQFGSDRPDLVYAMVADGSGNIYMAGGTEGDLPGQTSSGGVDAFIAKYDTSGNEMWTRQFGTGDFDIVRAMVADGSGNICVAGGTEGTFPGQTSSGGVDAFIAEYDASGNEIAMRQFGNLVNRYSYVMVADAVGNMYVANTVDEYPSSFLSCLSCGMAHDATNSHVLLTKYDTFGKEVWAGKFATDHWDTASEIVAEGSGDIYVAGKTGGDVFIMKLRD